MQGDCITSSLMQLETTYNFVTMGSNSYRAHSLELDTFCCFMDERRGYSQAALQFFCYLRAVVEGTKARTATRSADVVVPIMIRLDFAIEVAVRALSRADDLTVLKALRKLQRAAIGSSSGSGSSGGSGGGSTSPMALLDVNMSTAPREEPPLLRESSVRGGNQLLRSSSQGVQALGPSVLDAVVCLRQDSADLALDTSRFLHVVLLAFVGFEQSVRKQSSHRESETHKGVGVPVPALLVTLRLCSRFRSRNCFGNDWVRPWEARPD